LDCVAGITKDGCGWVGRLSSRGIGVAARFGGGLFKRNRVSRCLKLLSSSSVTVFLAFKSSSSASSTKEDSAMFRSVLQTSIFVSFLHEAAELLQFFMCLSMAVSLTQRCRLSM
jgi:hypothetical protein